MSGFLSDRDQRLWETDMAAAAADGWPLSEEVEATFERPVSGQPILEIVAGNTSWLDLTVGRYFAAMGDHLAEYLAIARQR